jgi:aspartate dehydrogenase
VPVDPDGRKLGILGAGTIACGVGERIVSGAVPGLGLLGFYARRPVSGLPGPQLASFDELLEAGIVVEAAGRDAVGQHAEAVLAGGADLVCCSVGALADPVLRDRLIGAAARSRSRLIVPSGAVGGLDLLRAAAEMGLDEVVIEQRKPPQTLLPEAEAATLDAPRVVYEGNVAEVVRLFPQTTNVAAAVALAGLGFDRTVARVVADPARAGNQVMLTARGAFGELLLRLDNAPSASPRTSAIVAHSVVSTLRRRSAPRGVPG